MADEAQLREFEQITEALERRANCARHLDDARKELIAATREADCSDLRAVHLDIVGSIARLDEARAMLVGSDE